MKTYTYWLHLRDYDGATVDMLPVHTATPRLSVAPLRAAAVLLTRRDQIAEWCDIYRDKQPGRPRPLLACVWKPCEPHGIQSVDVHVTEAGMAWHGMAKGATS